MVFPWMLVYTYIKQSALQKPKRGMTMKMNEVIKERRKALDMTQEQMAVYLGVTAPAVHKWEKGTSIPDVAILPALARILKIDLNTLFSFERELTDAEINLFCNDVVSKIQEEGYEAGFALAKEKIQEYPNCEKLIFNIASLLDGGLTMFCVEESGKYSEEIECLYERVAKAEDERIRDSANQLLIYKALQKKDFEKAQKIWEALPETTIDKKMLQATIYMNQNHEPEAIKILEEKLYTSATEIQNCLINLMTCMERENRVEEMEVCGQTLKSVVDTLGLWKYGKYMADYELAVYQKDRDKTLEALRQMLTAMDENYCLHDFVLYREIKAKENSNMQMMRNALIENLKKENGVDGMGFLKDDEELLQIFELHIKSVV